MFKKLVARDAPTWQFNLTMGKGGLTSQKVFSILFAKIELNDHAQPFLFSFKSLVISKNV